MINQDVDNLIEALAGLRLHRETTLRLLGDINQREFEVFEDLVVARTITAAASTEPKIKANTFPHAIGDKVTIGNHLRNEFGIKGIVTRSGARLVTIRNAESRKTYTRAWWNLNPTGADAQSKRR